MFAAKNELFTRPSGGYTIARSVRLRSSASAYLNRTFSTPTSSTIWTWSAWVKRGGLTGTYRLFGASTTTYLTFNSSDQLNLTLNGTSAATTTAVYRDPSSWYHIVYQQNGSAQTIYVNNVSVATGTTAAAIFNTAIAHQLGAANTTNYFDGYMTEVNFVDGQALTPSSFGATDAITGVWQPKKYSGTYGTNGFYLNFSSNSTAAALGTDSSGNSNTWTTNNISVTAGATYDSMTDVPTLTSSTANNYCVLNPLITDYTGGGISPGPRNGNLQLYRASASGWGMCGSTFGVSSGKWYWEATSEGGNGGVVGIHKTQPTGYAAIVGYNEPNGYGYGESGSKFNNNTGTSYGSAVVSGTVVGIALDMDAGTLTFYNNNTSQGTAFTGLSGTFMPAFSAAGPTSWNANFGQQGFTYTPPSGFVALNTYNLSTPTIANGAAYMAATTYTGTGAALTVANTVNGTSFQPDWVWVKGRSGATDHAWYDVVRGTTKQLESNTTTAETTEATGLTAFGSTGFTVGALAQMNTSAATYVAWQWAANGAGVSNTSGSITSTVSVNTTAGFAVVTYTGTGAAATVGHGLGAVPSMIIVKGRSTAGDPWAVYHSSLANTQYLYLNTTAAVATGINLWNSTTPTSSVFSVGSAQDTNRSAGTLVAYVFSAVAGYSAFGSYTGNGSTDGPFVYTGFRPRFILIKCSSNSTSSTVWTIFDTSRSPYNASVNELYANSSAAEGVDSSGIDILSNGFKPKRNSEYANLSGWTYIYACFAENPFKYSLAR